MGVTWSNFRWPRGRRAALRFSWDDARESQLDTGLPILDRHGFKATCYVLPDVVARRQPEWRQVVRRGHEIGNHTVTHPCSGNIPVFRDNALEDYTLPRIKREIVDADRALHRLLGVKPVTFAYGCANSFVGRGRRVRSYVPVVAGRFLAGRSAFQTVANDPQFCDLAHVFATQCDNRSYEELQRWVDQAFAAGRWLIFVGHEIGRAGELTTSSQALKRLCAYVAAKGRELWVAPVGAVARHIAAEREA